MKTQKFGADYHRRYYHEVRKQKIFDYLGGKCVSCGSIKDLEIDHINPAQKSFEVKSRLSLKNSKDEIDKCQLLCKNCHLEKTISQKKPFTHGTMYGWMKVKCDCSKCYEAKRRWHDARNIKRRKSKPSYSSG